MSDEEILNQDDPGIKEINIGILRQVMGLLYETHITKKNTAIRRGEAIRAVGDMLEHFGFMDGIAEHENIPLSARRRNSEIWNDPEEDEK